MNELTLFDLLHLKLIAEGNAISSESLNRAVNIKMTTLDMPYNGQRDLNATSGALSKLRHHRLIGQNRVLITNEANASLLWEVIGHDWHKWPRLVDFSFIKGQKK